MGSLSLPLEPFKTGLRLLNEESYAIIRNVSNSNYCFIPFMADIKLSLDISLFYFSYIFPALIVISHPAAALLYMDARV